MFRHTAEQTHSRDNSAYQKSHSQQILYDPYPSSHSAPLSPPIDYAPALQYGALLTPARRSEPEKYISPPPVRSFWKGLRAALTLIAFLFLALLTALIQHIINAYFRGRVASDSGAMSQSWTSTYNVGLAHLFGFLLRLSIGGSFFACLWRSVSSRALTLAELNAAFVLHRDLTSFRHLRMIGQLWAPASIAVAIWLAPLASIRTPASLTVTGDYRHTTATCNLSTIDYNVTQLDESDVFANFREGTFSTPSQLLVATGQRALVRQSFLPWSSPCGENCTYNLVFDAPAFECENGDWGFQNLSSWTSIYGKQFWAATMADDILSVMWTSGNMNCTAFNTTHVVEVRHDSSLDQSPAINVISTEIHDQLQTVDNAGIVPLTNMLGVRDAVITTLGGVVNLTADGQDPRLNIVDGTLVALAAFTNTSNKIQLQWFDVPNGIHSFMLNISLSLFSLPGTTSPSLEANTCTTSESINVYAYNASDLWIPYGSALGIGIIAVVLGISSLLTAGGKRGDSISELVTATSNPALAALARDEEQKKQVKLVLSDNDFGEKVFTVDGHQ